MKKSVIFGTTAAILVLGSSLGGGYIYLQHQLHNRLDAGIKMLEQSFPGSSIVYDCSVTNVFTRSAILEKVKIKGQSGQLYTMDKLNIKSGSRNGLMSATIDNFETKIDSDLMMNNGQIHVDHIDLNNFVPRKDLLDIDASGKIKSVYFSKAKFDLLNLKNITMKLSSGSEKIAIAQYQIKNYGLDRKSDQTLNDFRYYDKINNRDNYFNIQSLQIKDLSFAKFFQNIENGKTFEFASDEPKLFHIKNVELKIDAARYQLGDMQISTEKDGKNRLFRGNKFDNLQLQTDSDPRLYALKQYGYDQLNMFGNLSAQYHYDLQEWNLEPFQIGAKNIGNVKINARVKGPEKPSANNEMAMINDYKIVSFTMHFRDDGLIQHLADLKSREKNESVDQIKQEWIEDLQKPDRDFPELSKQAGNAVIDVIHYPDHELTIEVNPDKPYSFLDLTSYNASQIIDHLNIKVHSDSKH